jgi:hypothetical protein
MDNSKQFTRLQWAMLFGVRLRTVESWRSRGMVLDLWSAPKSNHWDSLKADAVRCLWENISYLEGNISR